MNTIRTLALTLVAATTLSGCVGANYLVVPVTHKAIELAGHAVDAGIEKVTGPKPARAPLSVEDMQAQASAACIEHKLSEADCASVQAQYAKVTAFVTGIGALEVAAEEQRKAERAAAFTPGNIAGDIMGGALQQGMALGGASMAGALSGAMNGLLP